MSRSRAFVAPLLAAIALGCADAPERVSVDLAQIQDARWATVVDAPPPAGASLPAMSVQLGAVPARALTFGESSERLDAAVELVEQSRALAYEQLLRSLRESYRAEAQRWTVDRLAQVKLESDGRYDAAFQELRAAFDLYAAVRGPLVARLTVLAGFPDLDPKSLVRVDPDKPQSARRAAESKELRGAIEQADSAFAARAKRILDAAGASIRSDEARLKAEIGAAMREADARAEEAAGEQMLQTRRDLDALLAQRTGVSLSPEPVVDVQLSQSPRTTVAPPVEISIPARVPLKDELAMWARSRGYLLEPKGRGVRDATKEFSEWMATHKVGR